jgi:hypothetical protein
MEVVDPLGELMGVGRRVQHAAVGAHALRRDPQEVRRRRVEVVGWRGKAHLVGEQLLGRIGPTRRLTIALRTGRWLSVNDRDIAHASLRSSTQGGGLFGKEGRQL